MFADAAGVRTLQPVAASRGKTLCLNMIVKNEMANLERCLSSVVDHITCWVIGDTGSTDGSQAFIRDFFGARGIPGELHSFPFENFEQARNEALKAAYASSLAFDYLLFTDADMELVVEDPEFRAKLTAPGYSLVQRSGVTYWNTRLVHREIGAKYHGVTHEYIDVPGGVEPLQGVWYKDHASGSNRVAKFERDIRLLLEGLEAEPDNARYRFYLAQSYRDAGRLHEAAEAYAKRAAMGGWEEEVWYSRLQEARCLRDLGDEGGFLRTALAAFNQRPQRAEPLYDLAHYYRERCLWDASALFSEAGLQLLPPSDDVLFVEDFAYTAGLKEEFSIAANYSTDPARKDRGFAACNWLALSRTIPEGSRGLAGQNLQFYVRPAAAMMPSFAAQRIDFAPPDGYRPMNPSIVQHGNRLLAVVRAVDYSVAEDREYGYHTAAGAPPSGRNFLLELDGNFAVRSAAEILPPTNLPVPAYRDNSVFADLRLFSWRNSLWCVGCYRELTREGWYEQVLARVDGDSSGEYRLADWRVLRPAPPQRHEKNWMPLVENEELRFIYLCDPVTVLDDQAGTLAARAPAVAADQFRGGSQAIPFDGGWLALVHETIWIKTETRRLYHHRFVWFDAEHALKRLSRPFVLNKPGIEFAAGLAWHADGERLLLSYGVEDREAWLATVAADDIRRVLDDADRLPFGASTSASRPDPAGSAEKAPGAVAEHGAGGKLDHEVLSPAPAADPDPLEPDSASTTAGPTAEPTTPPVSALSPAQERAHAACHRLALNRGAPPESRARARLNLVSFVGPAAALMPSFRARRIDFVPPEGYRSLNPSVAVGDGQIALIQRTVNYTLQDGQYVTPNGAPITTRNFLLSLDGALGVTWAAEILPPVDLPDPVFPLVRGFEDARLFSWRGRLWCVSNLREMTPEGWCEQVLARIETSGGESASTSCRLTDWRVLRPDGPRRHEKNWMPFVEPDDALRFVYLCDPTRILDDEARTVAESLPAIAAENFRGGSQVIAFEGGWLALIHEASWRGGRGCYHHRFVWLDVGYGLRQVSRGFYFHQPGIEFAAGLAWCPDGQRILVSYGVVDAESWIATISAKEVVSALEDSRGE